MLLKACHFSLLDGRLTNVENKANSWIHNPHWRIYMKTIGGLLLISFVLSACATGGEADSRWANYKSWTKIHNQPITGDHTGFLGGLHRGESGVRQVFVNDIGLSVATGSGPYSYPVGTVIAKEQYKDQAALDGGKNPGLTVMVKVSDNAENPVENWAWSRGYNATAKVDDAFCSSCHTIAAGSDYAFSNGTSLKDFQ